MRLCGQGQLVHLVASEQGWRAVAMPLYQPAVVVDLPEVDQGEAELLDGAEGPDPEEVVDCGSKRRGDCSQANRMRTSLPSL